MRITEYDRRRCFVDEMVAGPFRRWRHVHRFEATEGGTRMVDEVDHAAPVGPLGRLVERAVLHRYTTRLLQARNRHIEHVGEGAR